MALFDLNNLNNLNSIGGAGVSAGAARAFQSRGYQTEVPAPVRSVKRLASHLWPFSVKSTAANEIAPRRTPAAPDSSFLT